MDCITCVLMGMCFLCEPGFGGSIRHDKLSYGAADPGRPMTQSEVESSVENLVKQYETSAAVPTTRDLATPRSLSHESRQSFIDPKFAHMGIGKRDRSKLFRYLNLRNNKLNQLNSFDGIGNDLTSDGNLARRNGNDGVRYDVRSETDYLDSRYLDDSSEGSSQPLQASTYPDNSPEVSFQLLPLLDVHMSSASPSRIDTLTKDLYIELLADVLSRARMIAQKKNMADGKSPNVRDLTMGQKEQEAIDQYQFPPGIGR
ncbi:uncharacterized protein LOC106011349 [Aplysia californica]|uniref:Uncharacterized protein LOC106011349 n=1 Tax=Aplysia californica TaxID=6500 RepID=A0ABM0ZWR5_APLCA|nr:uncharacterized protein LOC106011349 [Aplysia californica]